MYPSAPASSTEQLSQDAGEVRAYLIEVRGGAPFLSSADAALLLDWLEASVPIPLITAAIDRVAIRRRKKRVRSRLTLAACRGEVRKSMKKQAQRNSSAPIVSEKIPTFESDPIQLQHEALRIFINELEASVPTMDLIPCWTQLIAALQQAGAQTNNIETCLTHAVSAIRVFHRDAWDAMQHQHSELRKAARKELAPLEGAVSERVFLELLEETARDQLRRQYPLVSADRLWDRLQP